MISRTARNAIAAISRLAELYREDGNHLVSSREIAESRNLPVPLVGKILTELSRGGLVSGSPGPGGGYQLAVPPAEISLKDVVTLFEQRNDDLCPFGPGWCGVEEPCPLHDSITAMQSDFDNFLTATSFSAFQPDKPKRRRAKKRK